MSISYLLGIPQNAGLLHGQFIMRIRSVFVGSISAILFTGCASVQLGDPARSAAIKKFEKAEENAQIYVCRDSRTFGMAIRPDIELDGKIVGTVARSTFAYAEVMPGNHTLVAKSMEHDSKLSFTVKPGEQRFFQTWISMGVLSGWGLIEEIDQIKGRACVTDGDLVEFAKN